MKTFAQLKGSLKSSTKKINGMPVVFTTGPGGVSVKIDGDELDTYPNQGQAEKMALAFIKQLKN
jgi:predicted transcriptional regulator